MKKNKYSSSYKKLNLLPQRVEKIDNLTAFFSGIKIRPSDLPYVGVCAAALLYFGWHDTLFLATLGCATILFMACWQVARAIPVVEKYVGIRITIWHVITLILGATMVVSQFEMPASAAFLSGLESTVTTLLSDSGITIAANAVKTTFNLIRIIFLLLVAAAGVFAFNQAQQGNDWRPIIGQIAIAFAVVIAIDLTTYIITGA
jgi:hypothetical protein